MSLNVEDDGWGPALAVIAQMREAEEDRQKPTQVCDYGYTLQLQLLQQQYVQDSAMRLHAYTQQQNVRRL